MTRVLLVPDLPLERFPVMDRYAHRLHDWLESTHPDVDVRLAAHIGDLTRERRQSPLDQQDPKIVGIEAEDDAVDRQRRPGVFVRIHERPP